MAADSGRIESTAWHVATVAALPRADPPRVPAGDIDIEPPPDIPRVVPANPLLKMLPVVMVVAMVGMVALMITSGAAANPMTLLFPAMMVVSMVGMFASGGRGGGGRTAELDESRTDYLGYLDGLRREVTATAAAQRASLAFVHPAPDDLSALAGTGRMWERAPSDSDFVHVRVGTGDQRLATRLVAPDTGPLDTLEPVSAVSLRSLVRTHAIVHDLPTAVSLRAFSRLVVDGPIDDARALVRSMLLQLCVFHSPRDLVVVVVRGRDARAEWDWVKWLPHHRHRQDVDGAGWARTTYRSMADASASLRSTVHGRGRFVRAASGGAATPHVVVVLDGDVPDAAVVAEFVDRESVTVVDLVGAEDAGATDASLVLVIDGARLGARSAVGVEMFGTVDSMSRECASACSRTLAPYEPERRPGDSGGEVTVSDAWDRLPGMGDPAHLDVETGWTAAIGRARLRVPIGRDGDGQVVEIDLKEAAEGGMGPHGLCIGATGSGKSELLRTLVLGLVTTHPPEVLNLVLVDFKGGATFLGLDRAPHVAAVITNLSDEAAMVERMRDALAGEMNRRQELLRASGNFANVSDYSRARREGSPLPPLPALFVVVDEFSELLSQYPEFADLFVAIGRLGRSLHIHLLLASQRLDEGRLRGLDSHLSYRIGLKTFSAGESRSVLGVTDAYHLPGTPGVGYLKTDSSDILRFHTAYVSGPYRPAVALSDPSGPRRHGGAVVRLFASDPVRGGDPLDVTEPVEDPTPETGTGPSSTVLDAVVERLQGRGTPAHRVWLPPLDGPVSLDSVRTAAPAHSLSAAIALIDRPYDQRRDPLMLDVTGSRGHVAVVGGPQSGKSTALRTVVLSLAASYSPRDVQFYCLDFGGGSLTGIAGLPHVGSVATRLEVDLVRRTVAEMTTVVRQRERTFHAEGLHSMSDARLRRAGRGCTDRLADVFLVIDGWAAFRSEFDGLEQSIAHIAATGLSYGVHVVLATGRWADVRPALKDLLASRVELRLGDPSDSEAGRTRAGSVPEGRPGRGITKDGLHLLVALPRLDGLGSTADMSVGLRSAVHDIAEAWDGPSAPSIPLLPRYLDRAEFLTRVSMPDAMTVPLGLDEDELAPVFADFTDSPHFLALGDGGCGKTTLLRSLCAGIVEANSPAAAKILLIDYRRTMFDSVPPEHLAGYASDPTAATAMIAELADRLRARRPGPATTRAELAARSWWTGPEVFVVVDDYDLVVTPSGNPLSNLLDVLSQARDVGVHLIVARRCGGAGRALYEPVLARLRELSSAGILMSGNRDEGTLLGSVRASEQPPGRGILVKRGIGVLVQTAGMADS